MASLVLTLATRESAGYAHLVRDEVDYRVRLRLES
jgi:hypothetical protein